MRNRVRTGAFTVCTMLYWFTLYTYVPILTPYVKSLGGSLFFTGLIVGSYGFIQLLARVPLGIWSDRVGKRKVFIVLSVLCGIVSSLGLGLTNNLWIILGLRALAGVSASGWVVFTVLYSGYFSDSESPKAMGFLKLYSSAGQMAGTALGGVLVASFDWHMPFFVGAAGGVLGLVAALLIPEAHQHAPRPDKRLSVRELLTIGGHWPLLYPAILAIFAQAITFTTVYGFTPLYALDIGTSTSELSLLMIGATLCNAVAGYVSGSFIVRKIGAKWTVVGGFALAALCTAAIPYIHTPFMLIVGQSLSGFGQGAVGPVLMSQAIQSVDSQRRATAMGFYQATYSLGMFGGPFIVGALGHFIGLSGGFLAVACLGASAAMLAGYWMRVRENDLRVTKEGLG